MKNIGQKKKRNIWITTSNMLWIITCILGMLYHIEHTTNNYLQYATTTEVLIKLEYEFNSPAVGLCFNPVAFRADELCPVDDNVSIIDMKQCYEEQVLYKLKLNEIMTNLSTELIL